MSARDPIRDELSQRSSELWRAIYKAAHDNTFSPSRGWSAVCMFVEIEDALASGSFQAEALKKVNRMFAEAKARAA